MVDIQQESENEMEDENKEVEDDSKEVEDDNKEVEDDSKEVEDDKKEVHDDKCNKRHDMGRYIFANIGILLTSIVVFSTSFLWKDVVVSSLNILCKSPFRKAMIMTIVAIIIIVIFACIFSVYYPSYLRTFC
jgi:uncharacterized membrane protein YcjF (UPF0283 family)